MRHGNPLPFVPCLWLCGTLIITAWFVTYGTWELLGQETRSVAFDSLAKSLVQFRADVEPESINWEGFDYNERRYMYFGLFPAVLRIPFALFVPDHYWYGWGARISLLLAVCWIWISGYRLATGSAREGRTGSLPSLVATLLVLGTPVIHLASCGRIYHEAIIWALAGSLAALSGLVRLLSSEQPSRYAKSEFAAGLAVAALARPTFAIPFAIFVGLRWSAVLVRRVRSRSGAYLPPELQSVAGFFLLTAAALLQLWYNDQRFGSPFILRNQTSYFTADKIFDIARVPELFTLYFRLSTEFFLSHPPYIIQPPASYAHPERFFEWREPVMSLSISSSWLLYGALVGVWALRNQLWSWKGLLLLCAAVQWLAVLSFPAATQRYAAEFLPLLLFLVVLGNTPPQRLSRLFLLLLGSISIGISGWSSITWNALQNGDAERKVRNALIQLVLPAPRLTVTPESVPADPGTVLAQGPLTGIGKHHDGSPLSLGGETFTSGFGIHAPETVLLAVPPNADRFEVLVGMTDYMRWCDRGSMRFTILQGEELLVQSQLHRYTTPPEVLSITLRGLGPLTLKTEMADTIPDCDWGVWASPLFFIHTAE